MMAPQSDAHSRPAADRHGWKLELPATPVRLEDEQLLGLRHPSEYPMLLQTRLVSSWPRASCLPAGRKLAALYLTVTKDGIGSRLCENAVIDYIRSTLFRRV